MTAAFSGKEAAARRRGKVSDSEGMVMGGLFTWEPILFCGIAQQTLRGPDKDHRQSESWLKFKRTSFPKAVNKKKAGSEMNPALG
jgi:hypothetical protein